MQNTKMPTTDKVREQLEACFPKLKGCLDEEKTLAELGIDSIDLVDLFCFIQSESGVAPGNLGIGPDTTVRELLRNLSERERAGTGGRAANPK